MTGTALHPSERAALRAARRPAQARAWRQAARIAAPIVAVIGAAGAAAIDWSSAGGMTHAALSPRPAAAARPLDPPAAVVPQPALPALASPAAGTTGTAELPPEPEMAAVTPVAEIGITPALPFQMRGASMTDRARALECLTAAIYYEAASEPDEGQRAVAQVVLNRVRHPAFPNTVCGVVYQGSARSSGCQFSYACDGSMARIPSRSGWARAARVAALALNGAVFAPVGLATHYHTYAVTPAWNRTLVMTDAIGAHFFHRWKGFWGTAAAFRQRYGGHEPFPGPEAKPMLPILSPIAPIPVIAAAAPVAVPATPIAQIQPSHRGSGVAIDAQPDSQILDRWKDSGKPLR